MAMAQATAYVDEVLRSLRAGFGDGVAPVRRDHWQKPGPYYTPPVPEAFESFGKAVAAHEMERKDEAAFFCRQRTLEGLYQHFSRMTPGTDEYRRMSTTIRHLSGELESVPLSLEVPCGQKAQKA